MNKNMPNAHEIVKALEDKGESANYILGFLVATINGLREAETQEEVLGYIKRSIDQAKK